MQFKPPGPHVPSKSKRSPSQFKSPDLHVQSGPKESPGQFKPPGPRVPSKSKRSPGQFKPPGPRVPFMSKRSLGQFKLPGSIIRSNISAPAAQARSSTLIPMPVRPPIIVEQPTQPLPPQRRVPVETAQVETQPLPVDLPFSETTESASTGVDKRLVWIMAVACGLSVGPLIYAQPLLAEMGRSFGVSINEIGLIATLGLLAYTFGLIFIVPLGEKYNQRRLVVILLGAVAVGLVEMAASPTVALLTIGSCAVGLASVAPELIVPLAASLAPPKERGRVIGTVLSGMFVGTPLSAVLSGFVGQYLGWRTMYWIAAGLMIALAIVLHFVLPNSRSTKRKMSYLRLLGSLWKLLRSEPVLQETSILVFLAYGSFTAFWVTLSFVLGTAPYHYGSDVVGLFGLVGIAGALVAPFVGKFADRRNPRYASGGALALMLLAFVVMLLVGQWLIGLIIGAILLDVGTQSQEVANEARIYGLESAASIRLHTIYMFFFCIGGSLGSALGTFSWSIAGHSGVYGTACVMLIAALGFYDLHGKRLRRWRKRLDQ